MSAVGGEWTHNVHREGIPWTFGLNSACGLLAVTVVTPSLALWATLGHLYADSTACFVGIAVAKELPQSLAAEVRDGVQLLCQAASFLLILDLNVQYGVFWWCWINWKAAEPVHMGLNFNRTMPHSEIVLLQSC